MRGRLLLSVVIAVSAAACGTSSSDSDSSSSEPPPADATTTNTPPTDAPSTDPPPTEPAATDPPATDPPATDPPATDPPATEPPATDPPATDPATPRLSWSQSLGCNRIVAVLPLELGGIETIVVRCSDTRAIGVTIDNGSVVFDDEQFADAVTLADGSIVWSNETQATATTDGGRAYRTIQPGGFIEDLGFVPAGTFARGHAVRPAPGGLLVNFFSLSSAIDGRASISSSQNYEVLSLTTGEVRRIEREDVLPLLEPPVQGIGGTFTLADGVLFFQISDQLAVVDPWTADVLWQTTDARVEWPGVLEQPFNTIGLTQIRPGEVVESVSGEAVPDTRVDGERIWRSNQPLTVADPDFGGFKYDGVEMFFNNGFRVIYVDDGSVSEVESQSPYIDVAFTDLGVAATAGGELFFEGWPT